MKESTSERPEAPSQVALLKDWQPPTLHVVFVAVDTKGDPTISDDGLGDGLFS